MVIPNAGSSVLYVSEQKAGCDTKLYAPLYSGI